MEFVCTVTDRGLARETLKVWFVSIFNNYPAKSRGISSDT